MATDEAVTLDIEGMTCASCVRRVERALSKVEGVDSASVNFASETARVTLGADIALDHLIAAVERAGYHAAPHVQSADRDARRAGDAQRTFWMLVVATVLGVPAIVLSMGMDIADVSIADSHRLTGWLVFALAGPIQLGLGWRFYRGSYVALRHINPNMDVLVALGTSVAFIYSATLVIMGEHRHMYFDVSVAVLLFITLGKYFEEQSKGSASRAIAELLGLSAKNAVVLRGGKEVEIPAESLAPGEIVVLRPGSRVPADGIIRAGSSALDESMLTGESIPVERGVGDHVIGGTVNQAGLLQVEVTAVGAQSALHRMARLVEEAQGSKAPIQKLVDRISAVFVPAVIVIAVAVLLGWGFLGAGWVDAMVYSVAVLVVACPCALGLATPTAIMVGTGMGARRGILIRNAEVLERVRGLDVIVLDKTGTLTEGRPQVTAVHPLADHSRESLLRLVASAESGSEHPLSRAMVDAAVEEGIQPAPASHFEALTARGVQAMVDEQVVLVGNRALFDDYGIPLPGEALAAIEGIEASGGTAVVAAADARIVGVLGIADTVKPNASRAVEALRRLGLRVIMMTGDNEHAARAVGAAAGIAEIHAAARPEDKLELVRRLQGEGHRVAMVGDGVNDSPALARADVGIAMSTGADAAIEAGDITLLHGDVSRIAEAIAIARSTLATIRQNLVWAFGYNVVMIPVAAAGLLNPILAGGAMALSSLSVMANSLRLQARSGRIARETGNRPPASGETLLQANRGPLIALGGSLVVLVLPLLVFTGVDRGWFAGDDSPAVGPREVRVELTNWKVETSRDSISAGPVEFTVVHPSGGHSHGAEPGLSHDFVVLRRIADGGVELVKRTQELGPGEQLSLTLDLAPGEYELQCDLVEVVDGKPVSHYQQGMHVVFRVTDAA